MKTRVAQVLGNRATVVARIMHHLEAGTRAELATAKGEEDVARRERKEKEKGRGREGKGGVVQRGGKMQWSGVGIIV